MMNIRMNAYVASPDPCHPYNGCLSLIAVDVIKKRCHEHAWLSHEDGIALPSSFWLPCQPFLAKAACIPNLHCHNVPLIAFNKVIPISPSNYHLHLHPKHQTYHHYPPPDHNSINHMHQFPLKTQSIPIIHTSDTSSWRENNMYIVEEKDSS